MNVSMVRRRRSPTSIASAIEILILLISNYFSMSTLDDSDDGNNVSSLSHSHTHTHRGETAFSYELASELHKGIQKVILSVQSGHREMVTISMVCMRWRYTEGRKRRNWIDRFPPQCDIVDVVRFHRIPMARSFKYPNGTFVELVCMGMAILFSFAKNRCIE